MESKPVYVKILNGEYKDMYGVCIRKEGEFFNVRLDNGNFIVVSEEDFIKEKMPIHVLFIGGIYKNHTGVYKRTVNGRLIIEVNGIPTREVSECRENVFMSEKYSI